jgi:hypothetical protein
MKILTITAIIALPLMALGQTTDTQQTQTQGQTKETQAIAPAKGKKMRPEQAEPGKPQAKPDAGTNVRRHTDVKGRTQDMNTNQPGARSSTSTSAGTSQTNVGSTSQTTTVNKQEFRSRHSEVFSLGRHPKEFFVQRFGASHFRLIGNTYFVFLDGCWVAVDVDGFVYMERVICAGEPEFIEIE